MSQTTHCLTIEVVKADFTRVALITASPNRIFIHVIGDPTQARESNGNTYPTILGRSCSYRIALRASSKIIPYNDIPSKYSRSDPNSDDATNSLTFVGGPDIFFWPKLLEQWSPRKQQSELQDFVLIYHQTFKATFISIQIDEQAQLSLVGDPVAMRSLLQSRTDGHSGISDKSVGWNYGKWERNGHTHATSGKQK